MKSRHRLTRKYCKLIDHWAHSESRHRCVPLFSKRWLNFEVMEQGKKIREKITNKSHAKNQGTTSTSLDD